MVTAMAALGIRQDLIVTRVVNPRTEAPIDAKTLRRAFRRELTAGSAEATQLVANALFRNAVQNDNVAAQIFWLKNRAPTEWRERTEHLHGGEVRAAIVIAGDSPEADI